jgi:hypothetical protein
MKRITLSAANFAAFITVMVALMSVAGCAAEGGNSGSHSGYRPASEVRISSEGFPLKHGVDTCTWSGVTIETVRYGAQILFADGGDLRFRSAEDMAAWYLTNRSVENIREILAVDFAHGKKLRPVGELVFLKSTNRPSPGGLFITPVEAANTRLRVNIHEAYPGVYLDWNELLILVEAELL